MPLYEYYCADCNGVFELLRPLRQATMDQPCPECDTESKRILSKDFATFTYRDGYARRIPDDGSYYHFGKKVSQGITYSTDGYTHPELEEKKGVAAPGIEDLEQYELLQEVKSKVGPNEERPQLFNDVARKEGEIKQRMSRSKGSRVEERAKQAALKAERELKKTQKTTD